MAKKQKTPMGIVFWVVLLSLLVLLYVANRVNFSGLIGNIGISEIVKKNFGGDYRIPPKETPTKPEPAPQPAPTPSTTSAPVPAPAPATTPAPAPAPAPAGQPAPAPATTSAPATQPAPAPAPAGRTAVPDPVKTPAEKSFPASEDPSRTRETRIYFVKLADDGGIKLVPVVRKIDVRPGPMAEALNALLRGPTREEKDKGLVSLIPEGSKLQSASVKDGVAHLSFNESFRFNSYGREGYQGQMRQIIFSITEFPTITAVQILIDGKLVQYLGPEGFNVGKPLGRDSF
jgi:hypothetical protein